MHANLATLVYGPRPASVFDNINLADMVRQAQAFVAFRRVAKRR